MMKIDYLANSFHSRFKIFHELMAKKIREVLLVSTPYDAWIMEEDCRLSERIVNEYRGLNLSKPPRLTWVSSAEEALKTLNKKQFNMVITMPRLSDMDAMTLGQEIKKKEPDLPVILLSHSTVPTRECYVDQSQPTGIDRIFVWSGNTDLLVSLIKSAEDRMNVDHDTKSAGIRVILFVEDSPEYISSLLPFFYRELVSQTLALMEEGLNEEHRLLTLRARPKILVSESYEEAIQLYEKFKPNVLGVISDMRFPRKCELDDNAGISLLTKIKKDRFDIPLLLTSSEPSNAEKAEKLGISFVDKNSPSLHSEIRSFFKEQLGFGDFLFRSPDGQVLERAGNIRSLVKILLTLSDESFTYHCNRNDFSRWLFARTEIVLASKVRPIRDTDFEDIESHRQYLISIIDQRRKRRQMGVVVNFDAGDFDVDTEFFKIGNGSLGGKARGLAFVSSLLARNSSLHKKFEGVNIHVPKTLVITTDGFESFIEENDLKGFSKADLPDETIASAFVRAQFPQWIEDNLYKYLSKVNYPLAIRSSSLLEDAQFRAYAGLYRTYMLPNDHSDINKRLQHLIHAIKLVYASTYFLAPKAFSSRVGHRTEEEKMAVIIQQLVGEKYGGFFYPAISGVAQSHNYYPFSRMKPEDGIATIAMGFGKMVVEGEKTLRFSPKHPQLLPQQSTVEDILENSQRHFYALKMGDVRQPLFVDDAANLYKREISNAVDETPMKLFASTYISEDHRIRHTTQIPGSRVLTFSQILKYNMFPLSAILNDILAMGQEGMGCLVELEFSVNIPSEKDRKPEFAFLQLRPMTARAELIDVDITDDDIKRAFCYSTHALGNAKREDITDIIYVKPDAFNPNRTREIAQEIGEMNLKMFRKGQKYLLIGPGRWGSADRWLGIPVKWTDISAVGAMVETAFEELKAEPSQGSHFFHNIATLGINYITISDDADEFLDWNWVTSLPAHMESTYLSHVKLRKPFILKVDGRRSHCVILKGSTT